MNRSLALVCILKVTHTPHSTLALAQFPHSKRLACSRQNRHSPTAFFLRGMNRSLALVCILKVARLPSSLR
jgi:hypothetical protein